MTAPEPLVARLGTLVKSLEGGPFAESPWTEAFQTALQVQDEMTPFFEEFFQDFYDEMITHVGEITSMVSSLEAGHKPGKDEISEGFRHCHMIKGSSATMGFNVLSYIALGMERILNELKSEHTGLSAELVRIFTEAHDLLRDSMDAIQPP